MRINCNVNIIFFKYYYYYLFYVLFFKFENKWNLFFNCIVIVEVNYVMLVVFVVLCYYFFLILYNFKFDNIVRGKDIRGLDVKKK